MDNLLVTAMNGKFNTVNSCTRLYQCRLPAQTWWQHSWAVPNVRTSNCVKYRHILISNRFVLTAVSCSSYWLVCNITAVNVFRITLYRDPFYVISSDVQQGATFMDKKQHWMAKISTSYRKLMLLNPFPMTDLRSEVELMHWLHMRSTAPPIHA